MFTTVCPGCEASLNAPDTLRGKKVKCKKCGEPFVAKPRGADDEEEPPRKTVKMKSVPPPPPKSRKDDDDDETDEAPSLAGKKASKRPVDDEDTEVMEAARDDADDEEDEPKPKKKKGAGKGKSKKKQGSPMLIILIAVGALVVLGGGSVGAYFIFFAEESKPTTPSAKGGTTTETSVPSKSGAVNTSAWVDLHEPEGKYHLKFPTAPQSISQPAPGPQGQVNLKVHMAGLEKEKEAFISTHQAMPADRMGTTDDQILDQTIELAKLQARGGNVSSIKAVTYQGFPGKEVVLTAPQGRQGLMVMRAIIAGDRAIVLVAGGETMTADSPRIKAFFESLKIE